MATLATKRPTKVVTGKSPVKPRLRVTRKAVRSSNVPPWPSSPDHSAGSRIIKLEREKKVLLKMLVATTEAIENSKGLLRGQPFVDAAHQAVAAKARQVMDKIAAA